MPGTTSRRGSAVHQFARRLPADLAGKCTGHSVVLTFDAMNGSPAVAVSTRLGREHVRLSLRTRDPHVAAQRSAATIAHLERVFADLRREAPTALSHMQVIALSKEVYDLVVGRCQHNPGSPARWAAFKALNRAAREGRLTSTNTPRLTAADGLPDERATFTAATAAAQPTTQAVNAMPVNEAAASAALEARFGNYADWLLASKAIRIDSDTRARLLVAVEAAATDAGWRMKRAANGDYSPDPKAHRFPEWSPPATAATADASATPPLQTQTTNGTRNRCPTWNDVISVWERAHAASGGPEPTRKEWRARIEAFAKFAGVGPAHVTDDHVRQYRDKRLTRVSAVTVGVTDLATIRTIFNRAIEDRLLPGPNPATGVRVAGLARAARRMNGFSNDTAARILSAATCAQQDYQHWVPWLCAFTGSRASAVMNLRAADVTEIDGFWCVEFMTEAGPLKTRHSERAVPLHPAIIKAGFLPFVGTRHGQRLFYDEHAATSGNQRRRQRHNPGKGRLNSLRRFLHGIDGIIIGRATGCDPNHAWRHWLKSRLREAGVSDSASDAITGHAPRSEGAAYGGTSIKAMHDALSRVAVPVLNRVTISAHDPGTVRRPEAAE